MTSIEQLSAWLQKKDEEEQDLDEELIDLLEHFAETESSCTETRS